MAERAAELTPSSQDDGWEELTDEQLEQRRLEQKGTKIPSAVASPKRESRQQQLLAAGGGYHSSPSGSSPERGAVAAAEPPPPEKAGRRWKAAGRQEPEQPAISSSQLWGLQGQDSETQTAPESFYPKSMPSSAPAKGLNPNARPFPDPQATSWPVETWQAGLQDQRYAHGEWESWLADQHQDTPWTQWGTGEGQKGSGYGRRGQAFGGSSWGEGLSREVKISKTLTQVLRHKAQEFKIDIRPDGFCTLSDVLALWWLTSLQCTEADVEKVVRESDKQRFELKEENGVKLIRAVQGHSIKAVDDEQLLRRLHHADPNLPETCVHGTYLRHVDGIKEHGLIAGGTAGQTFRNHIHFSQFEPGDKKVISGMRYDCEVGIWIKLKEAIEDGVPFFESVNKVILSPGLDGVIAPKYFEKALDLKTKQSLL